MTRSDNTPSRDGASEHVEPYTISNAELASRLDSLWSDGFLTPNGERASESTRRIGDYLVERPIGSGAFGVVFLAMHVESGREVALKVPRPEVLLSDELRQRFTSETVAVTKLDHPAIVKVYQCQADGPAPHIASAYCEGPNLRQWLEDERAAYAAKRYLDWKTVCSLIAALGEGLHYAHGCGVYHRDIKPENVLLFPRCENPVGVEDYEPRLTDFGLAKLAAGNVVDSRSSVVVGTAVYMAPEQIEGDESHDLAAAADIYSLGLVLFEMLTGRLPTDGETYLAILDQARRGELKSLRSLRPDLPRDLDRICRKSLKRNPAERFASVNEFVNALDAVRSGRNPEIRKASIIKRLSYAIRRTDWVLAAGWYSIVCHLVVALWTISAWRGSWTVVELGREQVVAIGIETAIIVVTLHLPALVIGWATTKRQAWALWAGLVIALVCWIAPVISLTYGPIAFDEIYSSRPYFSFAIYNMLLILFTTQVALYAAALAVRRYR